MPADDRALEDLRREIDEIDDAIHDLLIRRSEVTRRIGALKNDNGNRMRPGREAMVLRRLIARHRGSFPKALIVRIWREIFAAGTALQGPLAVAVYAPEGTFGYRNLARDHFGWRTPITAYKSAAQV
ncbi:MAG: chorismate mutase, partial [Alphaproteobacteria bacterium]